MDNLFNQVSAFLENTKRAMILYGLSMLLAGAMAIIFRDNKEILYCFLLADCLLFVAILGTNMQPVGAFFLAGIHAYLMMLVGTLLIISLNFWIAVSVGFLLAGLFVMKRPEKVSITVSIVGWLLFFSGLISLVLLTA